MTIKQLKWLESIVYPHYMITSINLCLKTSMIPQKLLPFRCQAYAKSLIE